MSQNQIAIINSRAPFSSSHAKDALDIALLFGSYEQNVSLFFLGDGVFQLTEQQLPELISQKDFIKTFSALPFYDIENIYVSSECLAERNLSHSIAVADVKVVVRENFANALSNCNQSFHF